MMLSIHLSTESFTQLATLSQDYGTVLNSSDSTSHAEEVLTHHDTEDGEINLITLRDAEGNRIHFHHTAQHTGD